MERQHISKSKAKELEDMIAFLTNILPVDNVEYYMTDDDKIELVEETKLLQELCLLNKRKLEILNKLTE